MVFQGSFKGVSRKFHGRGSFKDASRVFYDFQGCFQSVSRKFQKSFMLHGTHRSFPSRRRACSVQYSKCYYIVLLNLQIKGGQLFTDTFTTVATSIGLSCRSVIATELTTQIKTCGRRDDVQVEALARGGRQGNEAREEDIQGLIGR